MQFKEIKELLNNLELDSITKIVLESEIRNQFYNACEEADFIRVQEHLEIIKEAKLRINWENSFLCACRGGNIEVVRIIEKNIENNVELNYNSGLTHACRGGNIDTINLIIEKCIEHNVKIRWDRGFNGACLGGHLEIVKLMIENGANDWNWDWNWGLYYAYEGGHAVIIDLLLLYGAENTKVPFPQVLPKVYIEYKQAQLLIFTKLHESLVELVLTKF